MFQKIKNKFNFGYDGETIEEKGTTLPNALPINEIRVKVMNQKNLLLKNKYVEKRLKTINHVKL